MRKWTPNLKNYDKLITHYSPITTDLSETIDPNYVYDKKVYVTSKPILFAQRFLLKSILPFVKLFLKRNSLTIYNKENIDVYIKNRDIDQPLITLLNHTCPLDDTFVWCSLLQFLKSKSTCYRWTLTAADVCYSNYFNSNFFIMLRCLPIWRSVYSKTNTDFKIIKGLGIYQPTMNFALELLNKGDWINIYPQSKIVPNCHKEFVRLRWGISRLILDCTKIPTILPIWHCGFDDINPNETPYYKTIWKSFLSKPTKITICIGEPINIKKYIESNIDFISTIENKYSLLSHLTEEIQREFYKLKVIAEKLHSS